MIHPYRWILKRPGFIIPVFFLSQIPAQCQFPGKECGVAALGSAYTVRSGFCMAMHNQASLGQFRGHSISVQHARPGLCADLGISMVSLQLATSHGALGAALSRYGISGVGFTSAWLAYGITLHEGWSAGVGMHFWNTSVREKWLNRPCLSFAAGIRACINDAVSIAAHVIHPAGWYSPGSQPKHHPMTITAGGRWEMMPSACSYLELEFTTGFPVRWKVGLEWVENRGIGLQIGFHSQPLTIACGTSFTFQRWNIQTAFTYCLDAGNTPYAALTYEW